MRQSHDREGVLAEVSDHRGNMKRTAQLLNRIFAGVCGRPVLADENGYQRPVTQVTADAQGPRHERLAGDVTKEQSVDQRVLSLRRFGAALTSAQQGDCNAVGGTIKGVPGDPADGISAMKDVQPTPPLSAQHHCLPGAVVRFVCVAVRDIGGDRVMLDA